MADPCPFRNHAELIQFLGNNALTGGDNQVLIDGRERSGKTSLGRTTNRYLYQYLKRADIGHSLKVDEARAGPRPTIDLRRLSAEVKLAGGIPQHTGRPPRYLKPHEREWDFLSNVIFDFGDWEAIFDREEDLGQHQIDEAGNLLFSRNAQTGESKQVVQTVQMCGIRHATMIWILPNKHWMDPYVREHRATVWGHVHTSYTLNGMTRGLASWHWRQDNYMTGNVWWSPPIFWQEFEDLPRDDETKAYNIIKEAKLHNSTVADTWAKRRRAKT